MNFQLEPFPKNISGLAPSHLEDLRKSGLNDETIQEAGLKSVPPRLFKEILDHNAKIESMYLIPYPGTDFSRYKLFPPLTNREGHSQKYHQPKGSATRLYVPPGFDCTKKLWRITEGEKKALKATQEGLNCLGIGGAYSGAKKNGDGKSELIPDLQNIPWKNKTVEIIPDADFKTKEQVARGFYRFAKLLEEKGATVFIVELPDVLKLDDYLCQHTAADFEKLPRLTCQSNQFEEAKLAEAKKLTIQDIILSTGDLQKINFPPKKEYINPLIREGQIILISGWRGVGKTWFALSLANANTTGKRFGHWEIINSVPWLYLDGEMAIQDIQQRYRQLNPSGEEKAPLYFYSEAYANHLGLPRASLVNQEWRDNFKSVLLSMGIKIAVFDNIASLAPGIDENSKKDWDPINQYLLDLRFNGITSVLLHHVNKEGGQRGTSAREDNIDLSVMLKQPSGYLPESGADFIASFSKARVAYADLNKLQDVRFTLTEMDGDLTWEWRNVKAEIKQEVLRMIDQGMDYKDIASELGISKGRISQIKSEGKK
jgi:putative DNA primase/helicase